MIRRITGRSPLWVAARMILKAKARDFFGYIDKALLTLSLDDIHDLRVSSRRLREAVSLFEESYPLRRLRKLEKAAKFVTRLLGDIRNMDELMLFLKTLEKRLDDEQKRELARFYARCRRRRIRAVQVMEKELEKFTEDDRREALLKAIESNRLKRNLNNTIDPNQKISVYAAQVMKPRAAKVINFIEPALHEPDVMSQHKLRIAVKHFRYRTEMLAPLIGRGHASMISELKAYQTVLGEMHDMDVFKEMVGADGFSERLRDRLFVLIAEKRDMLFSKFKTMFGIGSLENVIARVEHALAKK